MNSRLMGGLAARVLVAAVLVLGSIGKVVDARDTLRFAAALFDSAGVPNALAGAAVAAVTGAELCVGLGLLLGRARSAWFVAAATILVALSGVLVWARVAIPNSSCGCFGAWSDGAALKSQFPLLLARNAALALVALAAGFTTQAPARTRTSCAAPRSGPRRAVTLIETLVSIAIVAVLLGLALPNLRTAAGNARLTISLKDHAQLGAVLSMYARDRGDQYPFLGTPRDPLAPIRVLGQLPPISFVSSGFFRDNSLFWIGEVDQYIDGGARVFDIHATHRPASEPIGAFVPSKISLTHTVLAAPRFWRLPSGGQGWGEANDIHSTRTSQLRAPTRKILLVDMSVGEPGDGHRWRLPGRPWSVGMGDGSARIVPERELPDIEKPTWVNHPLGTTYHPGMSTIAGLEGWDLH